MAKIEFEKRDCGKRLFSELELGTCFITGGEVYMKIEPIDDDDGYTVNAIFLETGESDYFEDDTIIEENRIYNTIQLKNRD